MKRTPEICLIALDLDGTTLTRHGLTHRTRAALETAIARGAHVVIATGRTLTALPEAVLNIAGLEYLITSNGAHISRLADGEIFYSNYLDAQALGRAADLLGQSQAVIEVFTGGRAYIDEAVYTDIRDNGTTLTSRSYVLRTRKPVVGIYDFLQAHIAEIENVNVLFDDPEARAAMRAKLEEIDNLTITSSSAKNLELGGATTSKATALSALCAQLGLSMGGVMACGDSPNDMAMLAEAGFSVAVANAAPEVLAMADVVAPSNEDEGVAWAVEKYVLAQTPKEVGPAGHAARQVYGKVYRLAAGIYRAIKYK